eukprot:1907637-Prymnesium_polylepis.1
MGGAWRTRSGPCWRLLALRRRLAEEGGPMGGCRLSGTARYLDAVVRSGGGGRANGRVSALRHGAVPRCSSTRQAARTATRGGASSP